MVRPAAVAVVAVAAGSSAPGGELDSVQTGIFERVSATYPNRPRRVALPAAILAVLVLLVGAGVVGTEIFTVVRYVVSILALISVVLVWQVRQWWWAIGLIPIAILWNPIFPIEIADIQLFQGLHYTAALVFIAVGVGARVTDSTSRG